MNEAHFMQWAEQQLEYKNRVVKQAILQTLWKADGELTALALFTRVKEQVGDVLNRPTDICQACGFQPADIIRLTATGIEALHDDSRL